MTPLDQHFAFANFLNGGFSLYSTGPEPTYCLIPPDFGEPTEIYTREEVFELFLKTLEQ